jgi:phage repressor protein C with HTH and peptisase S24 domain
VSCVCSALYTQPPDSTPNSRFPCRQKDYIPTPGERGEPMWSHESVWDAIDAIAARHGLSSSGLARQAGLDPTAFNPSKRHGHDGRPRWPSTESVAKVLAATGESVESFIGLTRGAGPDVAREIPITGSVPGQTVPLLGMAEAGAGGFFDDGGYPEGHGWDEIVFPALTDEAAYALRVSGDSMLPVYRDGDVIIVSPAAQVRRGDRVVVRTTDGEVMAKTLAKRTQTELELGSFNPEHAVRTLPFSQVDWMARILWASQ